MFLNKYLNSTYLKLLYDNYNVKYLNMLDESNFLKIYKLFEKHGFNFISDIILNYLEIFEYEEEQVEFAIDNLKLILGPDYVKKIGQNMTLLTKLIDLANNY